MKKRTITLWAVAFALISSTALYAAPATTSKGEHASSSSNSQVVAKVDINKANLEELEAIRGIGPALAERVMTYRNENGKFKAPQDLMNVKGIGQAKFNRIKEQLVV